VNKKGEIKVKTIVSHDILFDVTLERFAEMIIHKFTGLLKREISILKICQRKKNAERSHVQLTIKAIDTTLQRPLVIPCNNRLLSGRKIKRRNQRQILFLSHVRKSCRIKKIQIPMYGNRMLP
jgi:hypothetical protein